MISIESEHLRVGVKPLGAELSNLIDKRDGVEHMWSADAKFWPRHAPILFPTVGESKDGKITVEGTEFPMGRHGFVRHLDFEEVSRNDSEVQLRLNSNEITREHYPFEFVFEVIYRLEGHTLHQEHRVRNTDKRTLGFQLGGHPAFAVPFVQGESYEDYEVVFDCPQTLERHLLTGKGLYSGETRPFLKNGSKFGLSYDLFNEDALVFKDILSKKVWIQRKEGGKRLAVCYDQFLHLGIWSVPGADYVCLEPWIGCADSADQHSDFWMKDKLISLTPGDEFRAGFSISIESWTPADSTEN